jgi:hypothetical protein
MLLAALPLLLAGSAQAKDRPISDHTNAVSVVLSAAIEPRLELDFDHALSDQNSFTAGATFGRANNLITRLFNAASASLGGEDLKTTQMGAYGSFNRHFKHFNRGWYASGIVRFDRFASTYGDEPAGGYNQLAVGPAIGWKVATEGGFTFKWDLGLGYGARFGVEEGTADVKVTAPKSGIAGLGGLNLGFSF